jgi:hypothetical protein
MAREPVTGPAKYTRVTLENGNVNVLKQKGERSDEITAVGDKTCDVISGYY